MSDRTLKVKNPELKKEFQLVWNEIDSTAITAGTPITATTAIGTLTFTGVVAEGETITVGGDTYEFIDDGTAIAGNIVVDISGGVTATDAVTALVTSSANGTEPVALTDGADDTVVITANIAGVLANAIVTTTTCANGSFAHATLTGGADGTVATAGTMHVDATNLYVAIADCTATESHWKNIVLSV